MVFESLLTPESAERRPWLTLPIAFILTTIAIFLGNLIFPNEASLTIVFLTTLFFVPLLYKLMIYEEEKDLAASDEKSLLKQHALALKFFLFLFIGITFCFMFWYIILLQFPGIGIDAEQLFKVQSDTIQQIGGAPVSGQATVDVSASLTLTAVIFEHNLKVLIFCILFSFFYGAGAIFILTWNASVIGLALGKYVVAVLAVSEGASFWLYIQATGCAFTRYMIHGIPEIAAYFIAALAGGIISVAIIRYHFGSEKFEKIMVDAATLILIALVILLISAFVEVFLSLNHLRLVCL